MLKGPLQRVLTFGAAARLPVRLGIASGDPEPDGVVLWTRLAPDPIAEDGRGGMPDAGFPVRWQVSENDSMTRVVRQGVVRALPDLAHAVHVEVHGLRPGRDYWYRFAAGDEVSEIGHTRTAAGPHDGHAYTEVARGTWAADAREKSATFPATLARYVKLDAHTAVGGSFASAAKVSAR